MAKILIIDDEPSIRGVLQQLFEYEGHDVRLSGDALDGLEHLRRFEPDVTFLDVKMPGIDGLETLGRIRETDPGAVVVMVSGHGTIGTAVEATRRGAFDFLEKPLDTDRLLLTLRNALELRGLSHRVEVLEHEVESRHEIVGASFGVRQLVDRIERTAPTDATVLITGENGTGKELVARALHRLSPRGNGPWVEVNCAAIPSELIESELFGHLKGSFTGAVADRAGKFEQAHGGTLFLDEIGDMALSAQAKVLRALQERVVTRVGGEASIEVDVRIVAATNQNLDDRIETGDFRRDLLYRLNVVPIHVPALRERREDIPMLIRHFVDLAARSDHIRPRAFDEAAIDLLSSMAWQGNVRELKNTVERLLILASGEAVTEGDIRLLVGDGSGAPSIAADFEAATFAEFKERAERAYILHKLRQNDWNVSETARTIDMPRSNLYKKIERYGLVRETGADA